MQLYPEWKLLPGCFFAAKYRIKPPAGLSNSCWSGRFKPFRPECCLSLSISLYYAARSLDS